MTPYFSILILVFCVVLFVFNSRVNKTILYLIGFLIPFALYGILHYLVFFQDSAFYLALMNIQLMPLYYLAFPMIYFYVRNTLKDNNTLSSKDFLHFLPALISLISVVPFIFSDFDYKLSIAQQFLDNPNSIKTAHTNWFLPNYVNVILRPVLLFLYSFSCLVMIFNYSKKNRIYSPVLQKNLVIKWLTSISVATLLISLCYISITFVFFTTENIAKSAFNQMIITSISGFIYALIPLIIFVFPEILYGIPRKNPSKRTREAFSTSSKNGKAKTKKDEPKISDQDPLMETANLILNYLETNLPYLNPKFSLEDLANQLKIPKHHAYYCFNTLIKEKFTTMRNHLRVKHAKSLLNAQQINKHSIEGIGLMSGFASKSSFFATFKLVTGITPFEYFKNQTDNKNI
jgi:AraC-like DNA-binding protein